MTALTPSAPEPALDNDALQALDELLEDLRTRDDEVPQWDFCDGFLSALVCTRRPVAASEWLPMLLGNGHPLALAPDGGLERMAPFADLEQQQRFLALWELRRAEVAQQLDAEVESLDDDGAFVPEVLDLRGAILSLPEEERAEMEGEETPAYAQIWALGFLYVVEHWAEDWAPPREREQREWLAEALQSLAELAEDDAGVPTFNLYEEDAPPSVSEARVQLYGEAIWAVYDLRQLWRSLGPRVPTMYKDAQPGRNDPCSCGSGKKYKKCCGA